MSLMAKVMVVDADEARRKVLGEALSNGGFYVEESSSPETVVEAQMGLDPAVVVVGHPSAEAEARLVRELGKCPLPPPFVVVGVKEGARGRVDASRFVEYVEDVHEPRLHTAVERALEFRQLQLNYRESQSRLIQSERLATLGSMLAGLVHEIKTPLAAICGNSDVLDMAVEKVRKRFKDLVEEHPDLRPECESTSEVLEDTARTNRMASERLLAIVQGARNLTRSDAEREVVDLHQGIESSLILIAHELKGRIEVVRQFDELPSCVCSPGQINQVLLNLLLNAAQAIEDSGTIRVRTWTQNGTIRVSISDDGVGIPEDVQERIFEAGFTTKSSGVGFRPRTFNIQEYRSRSWGSSRSRKQPQFGIDVHHHFAEDTRQ